MVSVVDALARWIDARQYDNESLVDCTKRMKQLSDVVKSMIGDEILHIYATGLEGYEKLTDLSLIHI